MTLGQQPPDHNTSRTSTACATSWTPKHRRQHHRRDHTIAETMPSQRQHHRRDHHLGTAHLAGKIQGPGHPTQIPSETPRTLQSTLAQAWMRHQEKHQRHRSKVLQPRHGVSSVHLAAKHLRTRATNADHIGPQQCNALGTSQTCATQRGAPPPGSFSIEGGKDVAHSYLLEPTRPGRHFYCTCQNLP